MLFALAAAGSLTALLAAAPLDAPHAAVLAVLGQNDDAAGCDAGRKRKAAASATIRPLGRVGGDEVVLAQVEDPCICGAQNCPYYAIRLSPGKPRVLLSVFGIAERAADRAEPLPGLIVDAHDSAAVLYETTYAYRSGTYAVVDSARVRASDRARKPDAVPVRFTIGSSSAQLRGTAATGWDDVYVFAAAKGQRALIDGVRSRATVYLSIYGPDGAAMPSVRAGVAFTLPANGTYHLHVETVSDDDAAYAVRLTIR